MQHNTSQPVRPLVSCLMVTQEGRFKEIQQSINCFIQQQLQPIELVIVHDSGSAFHERLINLANDYPEADIQIHHEPNGHSLGWLRNSTVQHARAGLVCQWDDDDLNHPARLKLQFDMMQEEGTDFCFMTDQLHLYTEQELLFWDDWRHRPRPYDLIENTLLGRSKLMCNYPDIDRGEDTAIIGHILQNQYRVSRLSGMGWLYIYVYNGSNTWDFKHHSEISLLHRRNMDELLSARDTLEEELKQYRLPFEQIFMPHNKGKFEFRF